MKSSKRVVALDLVDWPLRGNNLARVLDRVASRLDIAGLDVVDTDLSRVGLKGSLVSETLYVPEAGTHALRTTILPWDGGERGGESWKRPWQRRR
ncbi:hypothetical protein L1887_59318 [Cichorium endivia]|nr:hypothetical protein L1887_59318 [Cichorium endivia]